MRNGALMTGSIICNSRPVDMRGVQFVPETGVRNGENGCPVTGLPLDPPTQFSPTSNAGHPNTVLLMSFSWPDAIRNCDCRRIGTTPTSMNGARATGPTIVMRYSTLLTKLKSPPGNTICWMGMGIVYGPARGFLGSFGTAEPSGFTRGITALLARKATGETERMSKPRRSVSPPR